MSKVLVSSQHMQDDQLQASPLAHVDSAAQLPADQPADSGVDSGVASQVPLRGSAQAFTVRSGIATPLPRNKLMVCERSSGLLVLRARESVKQLAQVLQQRYELNLPERLQYTSTANARLFWMTPDEWLLECAAEDAFDIESNIRAAVKKPLAIVNVSSAWCQLQLSGPCVHDVLKKCTPYDIHSSNFAPGKVVNTNFAKTTATLIAVDEQRVDIVVRRSFADYVWLWLQRSAREFGLDFSRT